MHATAVLIAIGVLVLSGAQGVAQSSDRVPRASASATINVPLVGVWRVVRFCITDSLGVQQLPFGRAIGYFIYTRGGRFSLQFSPPDPESPVSATSLAPLAPGERLSFERGYVGYFGTYSVTSDTTLVHHVEGASMSSYFRTDRPRSYRITGKQRDTLAIGDLHPGCRILVRVE